MSHAATKWAFDQPARFPDMKPAEWAVLVVLADCHNPAHGCFPSQDFIAGRINLSLRAVRDHLARLRERGLVLWEETRARGRRDANRYRLEFEDDFSATAGADALPDHPVEQPAESAAGSTGRIEPEQPADSDSFNRQNLPPNLVIEPVIEPDGRARAPEPPPVKGGSGTLRDGCPPSPVEPTGGNRHPPEGQPAEEKIDCRLEELQDLWRAQLSTIGNPERERKLWAALSADDRTIAARRAKGYLAAEGRRAKALTTWLGDGVFRHAPDPDSEPPARQMVELRSQAWFALFHRFRVFPAGSEERGKAEFMARQSRENSGYGARVDELPGEAEKARLVKVEKGSGAFLAWMRALRDDGLRIDEHFGCGAWIWVPSEWPGAATGAERHPPEGQPASGAGRAPDARTASKENGHT